MKKQRQLLYAIGVAAVAMSVAATPIEAQRGRGGRGAPQTPSAPAPRLPDGTPDFAGLWQGGGTNNGDISRALKPGEELIMLPWAEEHMTTLRSQNDPQANCLPSGVPRGAPYPWRMLQTPTHEPATHIFIVYEGNIHSYRQIFMDGRDHPRRSGPHLVWALDRPLGRRHAGGRHGGFQRSGSGSTTWGTRIRNNSTSWNGTREPTWTT